MAHGLLNFVKSCKFIACAYLLADVLPHLGRLSLIFQKQNVDLTLVRPYLKATVDAISLYKDTPGPQLSKVDHVIMSELKEFAIRATDAMKQDFKANVQSKYIQAVLDGLSDRFPNMSELVSFTHKSFHLKKSWPNMVRGSSKSSTSHM